MLDFNKPSSRILLIAVSFAVLFLIFQSYTVPFVSNLVATVLSFFDYCYLYLATLVLLGSLIIIISPLGRVRLGSGKPFVSTLSWVLMLFASGMGSGLIFWGISEPLVHLDVVDKFQFTANSDYSKALAATYFNWGLHAWGIYLLAGLMLAYSFFVKNNKTNNQVASVSESMQIKSKPLYFIINLVTVMSVLFGVVGTLANTLDLAAFGFNKKIFTDGFDKNTLKLILLFITFTLFTLSSFFGIKRGILVLSRVNCFIFMVLLLVVLSFADLSIFCKIFADSVIDYGKFLIKYSFYIPVNMKGWFANWSINYFLWWLAWAPFVGSFIAVISYGRTIAQFLSLGILLPSLVSLIWFSAFAAAAESNNLIPELKASLAQHYTDPLFTFFSNMPYGYVLIFLSIILLLMFVVTSADSAIYVLCFLSGSEDTSKYYKLALSFILLLLTVSLIYFDDLNLNRQVAVSWAIPYTLIYLFQCYNFICQLLKKN